jgi:hypothetical protein
MRFGVVVYMTVSETILGGEVSSRRTRDSVRAHLNREVRFRDIRHVTICECTSYNLS